MNINAAFPSKYLKSADLPTDRDIPVRMDYVQVEALDSGEDKPVLYFIDKTKGLVLNRTNSSMIEAAYGPETDEWHGREISIHVDSTMFGGRRVPCLRVKTPAGAVGPGTQFAPQEPAPATAPDHDPGDIPF